MRTEIIIIRATRTQNVLGEKGRRIRELTSLVQKRFKLPENSVELYAERVNNRGLCAIAQVESLRYKLLGGLAVRRACYGVLRFLWRMELKGVRYVNTWLSFFYFFKQLLLLYNTISNLRYHPSIVPFHLPA
ncbi:putative ribosomal protein S3 domain superfamily [Helianthus annuus]|uniref:Ribosomal protein S3 domain superfamily n=1 Tax=Helianthus annuus TaxID=4232 RepID=A0A9K3GTC4_HELAN|nr:putative ribosomal protein S3 domain superfamily [Helianthus annuus]